MSNRPDAFVRMARTIAVATLLSLIGLGLAWELWLAPTGSGTLALKVLPLVFCVAGLLHHRMVTYRWLSLAIWLYVAEGLVRIVDKPPANWCAGAEVLLSIVLFTACATQVRWRHAVARRQAAVDDPRADAGTAH